MEYVQKVLWHEGMFLTPNHFQQWDRHLDATLGRTVRALQPMFRGLLQLELDREALSAEIFGVGALSGVLPDGTGFHCPDHDPLPRPRSFQGLFDERRSRLGVHIALPAVRHGAPTSDDPARPSPTPLRYRRQAAEVRDEVHGGGERPVPVAVKDLSIRFDGEPMDGYVSLRIAELVRTGAGAYALADDFVPCALSLAAAPPLQRLLRRIVDICCARATELSAARRHRTAGMVEFSVSETANYAMLHTLNGAIPGLMHLLAQQQVHPERLYLALATLAGALHTFRGEGHPKDLPAYRHEEQAQTFATLDAKLRELLETTITARYTPLTLTRQAGGIHVARLPEAVLDGHRIYLSVQSSAPQEKVVQQTPVKAKVASSGRVPMLIASALKGIGLSYLSVPPGEIPAQPGSSYFELQRAGDEWDHVVETRTLAIFLPPDFTDLRMEFMAVKDE